MERIDVLVVGAGPAGLAAAIAAREAGCKSLRVIEREERAGGVLRQCIHNGFGLHRFGEELTGPEYAARDIRKAAELGIEIDVSTTVLSVSNDRVVTVISKSRGLETIACGAIVLAMGCRERPRGALSTPGTRPAGIYTAGNAQKMINLMGLMPGKHAVILGSGDIGLIMARRLTLQGAKVLACVEIMPYSGGLNRNIVQCLQDFDIPLYLSHTITDIRGSERLTGVTMSRVDENRVPIKGTETEFECDTLLLSCGLIPENELTQRAGVELDSATGGARVTDRLETSVSGVFACGNVLHVHDLVDYVSEESAVAGRAAYEYAQGARDFAGRVKVVSGNNVRGAVPQFIDKDSTGDVRIMFRVGKILKRARVLVTEGNNELLSVRKPVLVPGEMVNITLSGEKARSAGEITVSAFGGDE
ncbi:MAG: FAD-dependent oxidoreductase [Eubacteriales bacterium]|nr:FAD-dependent oxidoreductase [Eubacteriales bacterium]MDD3880804.1 FAD-dependent oxidoreductase [Eubacteriales bacterium]MDD4511829.1 FAD-dependent oxidoreductase [Eubacteriales bacterium]